MGTVVPDYYARFRCAAGACRHTCCAGWEIDIDADTRMRYRRIPGDLGRRLAAAIDERPTPHFRLGPGERCPFLNTENLCDIILVGGETLLCQICRDHPRFRSFLPGRTEEGLGLCCEAAGALILSQKEPVRLLDTEEISVSDPEAAALLALRDELIALAQDRSLPLPARMDRLLARCGAADPANTWTAWAGFFLDLERLDGTWTELLEHLRDRGDKVDIIQFQRYMAGRETEYEQLLVYFLYRHLLKAYDDGDVTSKVSFAVLSVRLLYTLGALHFDAHGAFSFADQVEYARRYSAEIEYSEENMDALFDRLWEGSWND